METLLQAVEYYATLASLQIDDYTYPKAQLDLIWKDIMLNQFHDVLPGTSIKMAIDDALEIYEKRKAEAETLLEKALSALLPGSSPIEIVDAESTLVLDPLRLPRTQVLCPGHDQLSEADDFALIKTDCSGVGRIEPSDSYLAPKAYVSGSSHILSNENLRLTISDGRVTSLVDLSFDRELILPGPRAVDAGLMLYEDLPIEYDAWDMEIYHLDCATTLRFDEVQVGSQTPLRASLIAMAKFGQSKVTLTVSETTGQS